MYVGTVVGDVFNYDVHTAWEFDAESPIRSPVIWYLLCGYPFSVVKMLKVTGIIRNLDSYWLLVAPRFMMSLISVLTDASGNCLPAI